MGLGVSNGNNKASILLYADNIAIMSDNQTNLQQMLNKRCEWCQSWCLSIVIKAELCILGKKEEKIRFFFFCWHNTVKNCVIADVGVQALIPACLNCIYFKSFNFL